VRASPFLSPSLVGETTHVPDSNCFPGPLCSSEIKVTITSTAGYSACLPAGGGEVEYTGRECEGNRILYSVAETKNPTRAGCVWKAGNFSLLSQVDTAYFTGFCGVSPSLPGGDQLPTTCHQACSTNLVGNMNTKIVSDAAIAASSFYAAGYEPHQGRFGTGQYWRANLTNKLGKNFTSHWIQFDLGVPKRIAAVRTRGAIGVNEWIKTYTLSVSNDGRSWAELNLGIKAMEGNVDVNSVQENKVDVASARYVRVTALTWNGWIAGRFEIRGCAAEADAVPPPVTGKKPTNAAASTFLSLLAVVIAVGSHLLFGAA